MLRLCNYCAGMYRMEEVEIFLVPREECESCGDMWSNPDEDDDSAEWEEC